MIIIPKKIQIGQVTYKVKLQEIEENALGYHEVIPKRQIVLDKNQTEDSLLNTFFHEVIHAILYEMGSKLTNNEMMVQCLANMFHQVVEQLEDEK